VTVRILKSQIQDEAAFRDALEKLRQAKIDHMMSGEIGTSPPSDPFLGQFIKRTPTGPDTPDDISIDYEIVNDDPPPPSEEELKARALTELRAQEQAEIAALTPANKTRLMQMEVSRAFRVPEDERSPGQAKIISDWQDLQKQIEEIQYAYAKREAEL
jgi:hypothetical protein